MSTEWRPSVSPWLVALPVMLATFLEVLDTTVVSVAQPNIAGGLGATNEEATWVLTSYLVANAIVLPASGWLSLRFGRKRFLLACTVIFTLASFVCGIAPNMAILILARVLQGAGGGALVPLSQAIMLESFPRKQQGMAMAVYGMGVVVAPILGPLVGGWLTDNYSWRWIFNINVPLGVLAVYLMARYVEDPPYVRDAKPGAIDGIGFGLLAVWLAALQIVLDKGQQEDWFASTWITWLSVISAAALVALVVRELRVAEPIVDLRVFQNRNFAVGTIVTAVVMAGMYSALTMLPMFLQTLMGYSSESSGVATAPRGIGALLAMPIAGVLLSYVDSRWLVSAGVVSVAVSTLMFGNLNLEVSMMSIVWPNILMGLGMGLVMVPLMTVSVGTLPNEKIGNGSGIFNLMRNLGGSIGISTSTTYLVRMTQVHQVNLVGHMTAYDAAFRERLAGMTAGLSQYHAAPDAQARAYGVMYGMMQQQANMKAYVDMFCWTALIMALCLPGAWLLKKAAAKGGMAMH
jgi:DHA2 family multidrug resistance protein